MEFDLLEIKIPRPEDLGKVFPPIPHSRFPREKNIFNLPRITLAKVDRLMLGSWSLFEYTFLGWEFVDGTDNSGNIRVLFCPRNGGREFWFISTLSHMIAVYEWFVKSRRSN